MYGWRARIGMVMAEVNTAMEPEFNRLAPEGVTVKWALRRASDK